MAKSPAPCYKSLLQKDLTASKLSCSTGLAARHDIHHIKTPPFLLSEVERLLKGFQYLPKVSTFATHLNFPAGDFIALQSRVVWFLAFLLG